MFTPPRARIGSLIRCQAFHGFDLSGILTPMVRPPVLFCVAFTLACAPAGGSDDTMATSNLSLGTTSVGETETGGEGPDLGICERYVECVEAASPETLTATKAVYGSEGACWDLEGVSEDDCHIECRAFLRAIIESFPEVEECFECVEDADCTPDTPYCHVDESMCWEEPQILSCDNWEIWGSCREFGEGFTHEQKRDWCANSDETAGNGWTSASPMPCKTDGAWGRCELIETDELGSDVGPFRIFYYYDNPDVMWTEADAVSKCDEAPGSTWIPY
jgi:hypothetical protein